MPNSITCRLFRGTLDKPIYFDFRQHFEDWHRYVLPIAILVASVLLMIGIFIKIRSDASKLVDLAAEPARVGLIKPGPEAIFDPAFATASPIEMVLAPTATTFDSPVGSRHSALTYNAQPFMTNQHLGDDLNGIGGWDSDHGDPVYAVSDGLVIYAGWASDGWGNVVVLLHEHINGKPFETFYGHLDSIHVPVGRRMRRGDSVGTIGTADGRYLAHLHFEIRRYATIDVGAGYDATRLGRLPGELSLQKWRGRDDDQLSVAPVGEPLPARPLQVEAPPPTP